MLSSECRYKLPIQLESTHEQAVSAERGRAEAESAAAHRAAEVRRLEQALEEEGVREALVEELRRQVEGLEEQLGRLQAEVSACGRNGAQALD